MNFESLILLFGAAFVVSLIPGPSTLIAFAHGARFGWGRSLYTALGNSSASAVQAIAATAGLGLVITTSATLFLIIKYVGAAYLIWMGIQMWRSAAELVETTGMNGVSEVSNRNLFSSGFTIAASNPKAIAFFTALFPQFLTAGNDGFLQLAMMVCVIALVAFSVAVLYGLAGAWLRSLELSKKIMKRIYRATGGLFVVSGIGLATARS
ncbi:lysine exporter protein LysE/YggA [Roseibium sp. TrichSKD4]|uniref:LysE family translocator n=1 Tax=Roseibium sp. TrichSKD4 TaxID=744980 RepID=UPI0001E56F79|nr:LysE family translocator [Roseibium sp. TrichSKD4]EFO30401.1 lysine exporter protein LysE/YggA [Roseibium sp. TrichSKD4]